MAEKTRYSDAELQEFKEIILAKLDKAYKDYEQLKNEVTNSDGNDTADTSPTFKGRRKHSQQRGVGTPGSAPDEVYPASESGSCQDREQNLRYLPRDGKTDSQGALEGCASRHSEHRGQTAGKFKKEVNFIDAEKENF